jgi:hypothetical protein
MLYGHPSDHPVAAQWQRWSSPPAPSVGRHHSNQAYTLTPIPVMKCLDVLLSSQRHVTMTNEAPRVVAIADADCGQLYLGEKFPSIIPSPLS